MRNWKAVIFDLDGTLTNTLADIGNAMNLALRQNGLPEWLIEDYRYLVGNGAKILAQRAVRDRQDLTEAVLAVYQQEYRAHSRVLTQPYNGIPNLLDRLNEEKIPVCVFSNKPHPQTEDVVKHYFPDTDFAVILGQTDRFPIKPDPAGALWIARQLGIPPEQFAYLGDTKVDMTCAKAAGMHPIGVLWGFREAPELIESGAERLITKPAELLEDN